MPAAARRAPAPATAASPVEAARLAAAGALGVRDTDVVVAVDDRAARFWAASFTELVEEGLRGPRIAAGRLRRSTGSWTARAERVLTPSDKGYRDALAHVLMSPETADRIVARAAEEDEVVSALDNYAEDEEEWERRAFIEEEAAAELYGDYEDEEEDY